MVNDPTSPSPPEAATVVIDDDTADSGDELDGLLRSLSRKLPDALVQAISPGSRFVEWQDTQLAQRQRRMDRSLIIERDGLRHRVHLEWQLRWQRSMSLRMLEYQVMDALAAREQHPPQAWSIESHLVLLSGRKRPWPAWRSVRLSPPDQPFSGVRFRVHAVYQRTMAELLSLGPLWGIFAPLAIDARAEPMREVLKKVESLSPTQELFAELASAMVAVASANPSQPKLAQFILELLPNEIAMNNPLYNLGREHGLQQGLEQGLERGLEQGLERGLERGLEHGLQQGLERGLEQGSAAGALREARRALRRVLRRRGFVVSAADDARIEANTDLESLESWLDNAVTVQSMDAVFDVA